MDDKELINKTQRLINELKWKRVAITKIPYSKQILQQLDLRNKDFESALTPERLESCREQLLEFLNWFVKEEKDYPDAPWLLSGGANNMIAKVHNRHNELLYKIAKTLWGKGIIGFLDKRASNYSQVKEAIEKEDGFDDEEVRDLRKALYVGK